MLGTGYVPVRYNGQIAKMVLKFDSSNPKGYIAGIRLDYARSNVETAQVPKSLGAFADEGIASIKEGDTVDFIADYYDYQGNFVDAYVIGNWTVSKNPEIINLVPGSGRTYAMYSFTDIYNQTYWTSAMK